MRKIKIIQGTDDQSAYEDEVNDFFATHSVLFWQDKSKYVHIPNDEFVHYHMVIEYEEDE